MILTSSINLALRMTSAPKVKIGLSRLLVLMTTLENSMHPKALANTTKHLAFARCGELNLYGMVEEHVATVERELFAGTV